MFPSYGVDYDDGDKNGAINLLSDVAGGDNMQSATPVYEKTENENENELKRPSHGAHFESFAANCRRDSCQTIDAKAATSTPPMGAICEPPQGAPSPPKPSSYCYSSTEGPLASNSLNYHVNVTG